MEKKIFLLQFDIAESPNETALTAMELDNGIIRMKAIDGFTATDILNIISRKGENDENKSNN